MFKTLTKNLEKAVKTLKGEGSITDINIATTLKEIRRSLVQADVHYKVAKQVTDTIKQKAIGTDIKTAISPGQLFTKLVQDELTILMGTAYAPIQLSGKPAIILLAGLQGAGKTTLAAKLANFYKNKNKTPLLVACDVYRPAAVDQLQKLGEKLEIPVYSESTEKNPLRIAENARQFANQQHLDLIIVDTAGRLSIDQTMMDEITQLKTYLKPSETLFVVDAMSGQDAVNTANIFNQQLDFDGVVLTKLDGDARGGAALSIRHIVQKPIKLMSTGEGVKDLDIFHPDRMAKRILGMGDVISLVERAQQVYDEEQYRDLTQRIKANQFTFNDLHEQIKQIKKLGNLQDLATMIPGMSKLQEKLPLEENTDILDKYQVIIGSMTPKERIHPSIIDRSRKVRIAQGSGTNLQDISNLLKHFDLIAKMMKKARQGNFMSGSKLTWPFKHSLN